jgi:hypothetical protein
MKDNNSSLEYLRSGANASDKQGIA